MRPVQDEIINTFLLDWYLCKLCLAKERVYDDCNEKVEEHLRDDHLEEDVKDYRKTIAAAFRPIDVIWIIAPGNNAIVVLVFFALIEDREGLGRVEHDRVPCFTC